MLRENERIDLSWVSGENSRIKCELMRDTSVGACACLVSRAA